MFIWAEVSSYDIETIHAEDEIDWHYSGMPGPSGHQEHVTQVRLTLRGGISAYAPRALVAHMLFGGDDYDSPAWDWRVRARSFATLDGQPVKVTRKRMTA